MLAGTALFVVAAVMAVMIAPARLQLVLYIESTGANEIVLPLGYWGAAALWGWLSIRAFGVPVTRGLGAAVAIAFAFHVLLLTAAFARLLPDAAAFSSGFYHLYARLFCSLILAGAAWRSVRILRQSSRQVMSPFALELPIVAGTLVLLTVLIRHDAIVATGGLVLAFALVLLEALRARLPFGEARLFAHLIENERLFLLMLFLGAVTLRILYLQRVMTNPGYVATGGDGEVYDTLAWSIATGNGVPATFRDGYPLLLLGYVWLVGAVYAIAGHSYLAIGVVQSVLGAAACLLLYAIGKSLFGATAARIAAMFTAVSFSLIFAAAAIGHQAVDVFLTMLLAWLLIRTTDRPDHEHGLARWIGIGLVVGCAIAVRETNAFVLFFVLCWMAIVLRHTISPSRIRAMAAVSAAVAAVLLPLMLPTFSTADGRLRLRQHFDRLYQGQGDAVRTRKDLVGPLEDPQAAFVQFRSQPGVVAGTLVRAMAHNFALQFFTQPFGGFDLVFLAKGSAYYYGQWVYAYALACAGLVIAVRQAAAGGVRAMGVVLMIGVIAFRTIPHLLLESHYRHRVPIEPFLILLASVAAAGLMRSIRAWHTAPSLLPEARATA